MRLSLIFNLITIAATIGTTINVVAVPEQPGIGIGAFPVSESLVSMWIHEIEDGNPQPTLLVFFAGSPGWHNRKWETKFNGNIKTSQDTSYELVSSDVILSIKISADLKTAFVQDNEFSLKKSNVFLVHEADQGSAHESILSLGSYVLPKSAGVPLPTIILREYPEIAKQVFE